jgi:hypothetical protein
VAIGWPIAILGVFVGDKPSTSKNHHVWKQEFLERVEKIRTSMSRSGMLSVPHFLTPPKEIRMKRILFLAVAAIALGMGLASTPVQAADTCAPYCYKHPITGQLVCTSPCP